MSDAMTPERRKQIKRFTTDPMAMSDFNLTPALLNECLDEIERLQAPLPEDLENQLAEAENAWPKWVGDKRDRWAELRGMVRGLTTTLRSLWRENIDLRAGRG